MELKEKLQKALEAVENGDAAAAGEAVADLKALPRTAEGIFDLTCVDGDIWSAAGLAYPVYVAYETLCNKKEGYPDLIAQMRVWNGMLQADYSFGHAAKAADLWIHTLQYMSPEIYEYYRELMDLFKANVRETLAKFYDTNAAKDAADAELFKAAVLQACAADILLAEKYEKRV
ncbi:MAG: hypothetical protein NC399_02700 [Muribaculum sp.]|nr:hypothetical protein [Muribaculum sp.]